MLEEYFVKPATIDRLRGSWIAAEIESYLVWLVEQGYRPKTIWRRVPIAFAFGEFARGRGASTIGDLPAHVEAFVADRVARHHAYTGSKRPMAKEVRALSSSCSRLRFLALGPVAGHSTLSRSSTLFPASSTTWSRSGVFARRQCWVIAIISTASRPTWDGSASSRSESSRRRS